MDDDWTTEIEEKVNEFDDAIHQWVNALSRPKKGTAGQAQLDKALKRMMPLCAQDKTKWKIFLLAVIYKRYHALSPQCKEEIATAAAASSDNKATATDDDEDDPVKSKKMAVTAGAGERFIFYKTVRFLFETSTDTGARMTTSATTNVNVKSMAGPALNALLKVAPWAGGSRDVAALISELLETSLTATLKERRADMWTVKPQESLSLLGAMGFQVMLEKFQQAKNHPNPDVDGLVAYSALDDLIQLAADTLDQDLDIIHKDKMQRSSESADTEAAAEASSETGDKKPIQKTRELPSTLHMFVPHHDRGRSRKQKRSESSVVGDRILSNVVAELLIWSRTSRGQQDGHFQDLFWKYLKADNKEAAKPPLFSIQATIRRWRKELNSYARNQGFMLSDQFVLDADRLNFSKINRGKAGDLALLTRLATKKQNTKVLKLVQLRNSCNPTKIIKYASIQEIIYAMKKMIVPDVNDNAEVNEIEKDIHRARVKATLVYLRDCVKQMDDTEKTQTALVASIENSNENHVAAILVAAAWSKFSLVDDEARSTNAEATTSATSTATSSGLKEIKLYLAGNVFELNSFQDVWNLLEKASCGDIKGEQDAETFVGDSGVATVKSVVNLIDRHLSDSGFLLLFSSSDMKLPENVMTPLTNRGCSIHCHDASDNMKERLQREKAARGDITISLAWDTRDDLDMHVVIPSGEEICYHTLKSQDLSCFLDVDMNVSGESKEPVENLVAGNEEKCEQAPQGKYSVIVQNFCCHESPKEKPIPFRLVVDKNGIKEKFQGECTGAGSQSNVTVCEFEYHGRTVPFPKEQATASTFAASNLVNLTSSTGQTLEALSNLVQVLQQTTYLNTVRTLVEDEDEKMQEEKAPVRPVAAAQGKLEVTSRDRVNILLAKLPNKFHRIVGEAFGGDSLAERCAEDIARRMIADRIPIHQLKRSGYPDDVVRAVKLKMGTIGET